MGDEERARLMALGLSLFYDSSIDNETNPDYARLLGGFLTILFTYIDAAGLPATGIQEKLRQWNYKLSITYVRGKEELETMTNIQVNMFKDLFHTPDLEALYSQLPVIANSIMILIGKNVQDVARKGWFQNRWRALANILAVKIPVDGIPPPTQGSCTGIYQFLAAKSQLRSQIFKVYRSLAAKTDSGFSIVFERIIALLQWAEMSHIHMIQCYIFDQNKEILSFPELSGPESSPMMAALQCLLKFDEDDRPFLRLLQDQEDLTPLQSRNFRHFAAAAHVIASIDSASMRNYVVDKRSDLAAFQDNVRQFVMRKREIGSLLASHSFAVGRPAAIQEELIRHKTLLFFKNFRFSRISLVLLIVATWG